MLLACFSYMELLHHSKSRREPSSLVLKCLTVPDMQSPIMHASIPTAAVTSAHRPPSLSALACLPRGFMKSCSQSALLCSSFPSPPTHIHTSTNRGSTAHTRADCPPPRARVCGRADAAAVCGVGAAGERTVRFGRWPRPRAGLVTACSVPRQLSAPRQQAMAAAGATRRGCRGAAAPPHLKSHKSAPTDRPSLDHVQKGLSALSGHADAVAVWPRPNGSENLVG